MADKLGYLINCCIAGKPVASIESLPRNRYRVSGTYHTLILKVYRYGRLLGEWHICKPHFIKKEKQKIKAEKLNTILNRTSVVLFHEPLSGGMFLQHNRRPCIDCSYCARWSVVKMSGRPIDLQSLLTHPHFLGYNKLNFIFS